MGNNYNVGTGWGFPPEFKNNGKDVTLVSDETEINQALEILFSTALKERYYWESYGCDMKGFLFEEINKELVKEIEDLIINAVYDFEPRINVLKVNVDEVLEDASKLVITINYLIVQTGNTDSFEYTLSIY